jgi:hypothetical protein
MKYPRPQSSTKGPWPSQSTKTVSTGGQNRPQPGGTAGAGKARGQANMPNPSKTTPGKTHR